MPAAQVFSMYYPASVVLTKEYLYSRPFFWRCAVGRSFCSIVWTRGGVAGTPHPLQPLNLLPAGRFLDIVLCSRGFMYKYLGIWKLGEAPNVLTGLSYNGVDSDGEPRWDGVTNIYLLGMYVHACFFVSVFSSQLRLAFTSFILF